MTARKTNPLWRAWRKTRGGAPTDAVEAEAIEVVDGEVWHFGPRDHEVGRWLARRRRLRILRGLWATYEATALESVRPDTTLEEALRRRPFRTANAAAALRRCPFCRAVMWFYNDRTVYVACKACLTFKRPLLDHLPKTPDVTVPLP